MTIPTTAASGLGAAVWSSPRRARGQRFHGMNAFLAELHDRIGEHGLADRSGFEQRIPVDRGGVPASS